MMRKTYGVMLAAAALAGAYAVTMPVMPARADDDGATAAYLRSVTVMNLDAEARRTVAQDRVQATLTYQTTAKTAAEAQAEVNRKLQAGLAVANAAKGVKVNTGSYNTWKQYPPEPGPKPLAQAEREKNVTWTASQSLQLDGADKDALLKLVGQLQGQGFATDGLSFYLSREAADKLKDELTVEALGTIQARAKAIAGTLGVPNVHIARITIGNVAQPYQPRMMMAMAKADMAGEAAPAPVAQAGESDVSVNVNVEVHLSK